MFTRLGFYSVVAASPEPDDKLMVRSRCKHDLRSLLDFMQDHDIGTDAYDIVTTPHADYPFRIFVTREVWMALAAALAGDVDYGNFKSEVGKDDPKRAHVYHDVWQVLWNAFKGMRPKR